MRHSKSLGLLAAAVLVSSCSDPSTPPVPASIAVVSGSGQSAAVGVMLPAPVVVEVKDANGRAVRGAAVTWTIAEGNGTLSRATSSTDRNGRTDVQWTLGTSVGPNRLTAAVGAVTPATATATSSPGAPTIIYIVSGSQQSGVVGTQLNGALITRVTDAHSNPAAGATVVFSPSAGTVQPPSVQTSSNGFAVATWTLGAEVGEQTLDATISGTPVTARFIATAHPVPIIADLEPGVPAPNLSAALGSLRYYRIAVPEHATKLSVALTGGPGDVDLYVRRGELPSTSQFHCRSISPIATESCVVPGPEAGDWYVLLHAFTAYENVTLSASYIVGGSLVLAVTGLPDGVNAGINVLGPGTFARTVNGSQTLAALPPGSYTISAPHVQGAGSIYSAAPGTQVVEVSSGVQSSANVAYAQTTGGVNLDITGLHITQSVQRSDGSVPLVAGREGLLRVFARGNALTTQRPPVRVRVYHNGSLADTRVIAAAAGSVPLAGNDDDDTSTWNVVLPGFLIQQGMSILVDIDPDNAVSETNEDDNTFPVSGAPLPLTVANATPLQARFVPVLQVPNGLVGDVTSASVSSYINTAYAMFPVPSIDADVRQPYAFSGALTAQYDTVWQRLLNEVLTLRNADASTRYYYGVVKPAYTSGGTGLGYIGLPAAIGVDWSSWRAETVVHEWGHNFGRYHVACGNPSNPDPNYPYTDRPGAVGRNGWDVRTQTFKARQTHQDVMSYCQPTWVSDYTYEAVLDFRAAGSGSAAVEPALLIWGRMSADGVVLEPAFEVITHPVLPRKSGSWRIVGTDAAGAQILNLSFEPAPIDHLSDAHHFSFAVPLRLLRGRDPAELRLEGAGGRAVVSRAAAATALDVAAEREGAGMVRLRWDASRAPVLMVRDAATNEVLSFARGGDARIATRSGALSVSVSDGVRSSARRITVDQ